VYEGCLAENIQPAIVCVFQRNAGKHQHALSHKVIFMASQFLENTIQSNTFYILHLHRSPLSRIREIPDLNIGQETGYPNWCFSQASSVPPHKLGHDRFLPLPFHLTNHLIVRRHTGWATDSIIK
jgi:hypothetical protein